VIATLTSGLAAFNLVCTVQTTFIDHKKQDGPSFPIEYRVDLAAGRFCVGVCEETRPIAKVDPTDIYLVADRYPDGTNKEFIWISRESASYLWVLGEGSIELRSVGKCEKRPFTGFPARKF